MIHMPHRSVTRFFIPMIDVLTVLFCMFLLMPIFRENESQSEQSETETKKIVADVQKELQDLYREQDRARASLARLEIARRDFLQKNLYVRVIGINPKDGTLSFLDPLNPALPPAQIGTADEARQLIAKHKREAGPLELFYVFQMGYDPSVGGEFKELPRQAQVAEYERWFAGVGYGGWMSPRPKGNGESN